MLFNDEIIRSRQNRRVVELCKLTDRKAREATRRFRFDGIKLLQEAIKNGVEIEWIFLKESRSAEIRCVLEKPDGTDVFGNETTLLSGIVGLARVLEEEHGIGFEKISEVLKVTKLFKELQGLK